MHGDEEKFFPAGWCTDMASGNFICLVKIYREDVLETVKGCQFHFWRFSKSKSDVIW